jgi:hypothetical protein
MLDVGNSSQCWDLITCPYFADTTERGDKGWNEAQRQGEDRVILWITGTNFNSSHAGYPAKLNGSAIAHVYSQK